jgi:hypothetical protein
MVREYERLFRQISVMVVSPEDVACPMLWSDPLSEMFGGLA